MRAVIGLGTAIVVIFADQWTKMLAIEALRPYEPTEVLAVLNWTLAFNTGAAFSFLDSAGGWQKSFFASFSGVMSIILLVWLFRLPKSARGMSIALGLILGGAIGNLIDRLRIGHVVDFIDVHYKHHHWPIFNIADSAICVGAVLLILLTLCEDRNAG